MELITEYSKSKLMLSLLENFYYLLKNNQKLENFSGEYILIDNMLYIDNLEINEQKIPNKINLSEIYQSCNQN